MRDLIRQLEERQAALFSDMADAIESEFEERERQHAIEEHVDA